MESCRDIASIMTRVADDEAAATDRGRFDRHVLECVACSRAFQAEREARALLRSRAAALVGHAPLGLRGKCAGAGRHAVQPIRRPAAFLSRASWPMALAATLVLAVAGVAVYGIAINPAKAAAAQLTLDHLKCFSLFEEPAGVEPAAVQAALREHYGFDISLPAAVPPQDLKLVGGRRCVYLDGAVAHLLYRKGAVRVSLFVLPTGTKLRHTQVEVLGHTAVAFERNGRTWVALARAPRAELATVADALATAQK